MNISAARSPASGFIPFELYKFTETLKLLKIPSEKWNNYTQTIPFINTRHYTQTKTTNLTKI